MDRKWILICRRDFVSTIKGRNRMRFQPVGRAWPLSRNEFVMHLGARHIYEWFGQYIRGSNFGHNTIVKFADWVHQLLGNLKRSLD